MNTKFLGAVAGVVAVLVVAWFLLLWKPVGHRMTTTRATEAQAVQTLNSLRLRVQTLRIEEAKAPEQRAALRRLDAAIPSSPQLSSALRQIAQVATKSGATVSQVTPSAPSTTAPSGGPVALPLSIAAAGSYDQLTTFVNRLETLPRLFVLSSINLSRGGGATSSSGMTLALQLDMFYAPAG